MLNLEVHKPLCTLLCCRCLTVGQIVFSSAFPIGNTFWQHYILSRVKQITSPGWMHETSAQTWCTGKTQRERVEREVGGGIGMGNTCKTTADSCQCMTKPTTIL